MVANNHSITSEDLIARKGTVSLAVRRKRALRQLNSETAAVVLVHGSSLSALPTFDLSIDGKADYSMMDHLALGGFDVWTFDHEGYGGSTVTDSNSNVACGVQDLEAITSLIVNETKRQSVHLYGLSSGALRAAAFAVAHPARVGRLVLDGFVWTGKGSPTLSKRGAGAAFYHTHARREIDSEFLTSIFTRDQDGTTDPDVIAACVRAQLDYGSSVPTGTYLDMTTNLPLVDPAYIRQPTAIVRGEHDGIATVEDLLAFFLRLPNPDKQFTVVPGLAHCTPLGRERKRMWRVVAAFLRAGD